MSATIESIEGFSKTIKDAIEGLVAEALSVVSPTPDLVLYIAPGEAVAWDDNCEGQLWGRLARVSPPATFQPMGNGGARACQMPHFILTIELGIIRCAAVLDDDGNAPSAGEILADGRQGIDDMSALLGVLRCWEGLRSLEGWTPQGPEGGYFGGYWTFTSLMPNCFVCEEPVPDPDPEEPEDG